MNRWIKITMLVVLAATAVGLVILAFRPQPVTVDIAELKRGPMYVSVDEDGKTRIKERYVVSSPLSGRLLRIGLDPGDPVVRTKTTIATIEPTDPSLLDARAMAQAEAKVNASKAAMERAAPELERARLAMEFAESERARISGLFESGAVTETEFEAAELAYRDRNQQFRAARFSEEIARFELEMAKAALRRTDPEISNTDKLNFRIHSPINGRVLRVFQESTTVLTAGSQLIELGDPKDLEIVVDVLSKDAVSIEPGAAVILEQWGGAEALMGTVRLVEPQAFTKISALGVEEQRVNVIIDFLTRPAKSESLGDGYRVEARIVVWKGDDILTVPTSALFRRQEDSAVFIVLGDRAELRTVKIGHRSGFEAEVLSGLEAGDQVILYPSDKVKEGVAVVPRS